MQITGLGLRLPTASPHVKLCKDCRWAGLEDRGGGAMTWICSHRSARFVPDPDYVTGKPVEVVQLSCRDVRRGWRPSDCGPQGRHWEARQ